MTEDVVSALQQLAEVIQDEESLGAALASIAEATTTSVPGCDAASIAISLEGRPVTAAMTARIALELDMVQYDTHDGPCLSSFPIDERASSRHRRRRRHVPALQQSRTAPRGAGSSVVPAMWGNDIVGTVNLYSRTGPFDETAETIARRPRRPGRDRRQPLARVRRRPQRGRTRPARPRRPGSGRIATGLLMVNEACTAEQAERLLQLRRDPRREDHPRDRQAHRRSAPPRLADRDLPPDTWRGHHSERNLLAVSRARTVVAQSHGSGQEVGDR